MVEKKTEVMTIRVTAKTKQAIENEAKKHEWTPSKMAEKILTAWVEGGAGSSRAGPQGDPPHSESRGQVP